MHRRVVHTWRAPFWKCTMVQSPLRYPHYWIEPGTHLSAVGCANDMATPLCHIPSEQRTQYSTQPPHLYFTTPNTALLSQTPVSYAISQLHHTSLSYAISYLRHTSPRYAMYLCHTLISYAISYLVHHHDLATPQGKFTASGPNIKFPTHVSQFLDRKNRRKKLTLFSLAQFGWGTSSLSVACSMAELGRQLQKAIHNFNITIEFKKI